MQNKVDLSIAQKQSKKGVFLLFVYTLYKFFRAFFPVFIVFAFGKKFSESFMYWYVGISLFVLLATITTYIKYRFFVFYIDRNTKEFVLQKGWLNTSKTVIKLNKIQQVNLSQKVLHQLLQVYEVEIDTAGSQQVEVKIQAVSGTVAQELRKQLLEQQREDTATEESEKCAQEETFDRKNEIQISLASLIKVGLTRRYIQTFSLLFVFLFQGLEKYRQYFNQEEEETSVYADATRYATDHFSEYIFILSIFVVFALVVFINLFRTLLQFFNFKITFESDHLLISYGLLETKNTIIKPSRVQFLQISQNYFQKLLRVFELKIAQAISQDAKNNQKAGIEIPGVSLEEKNQIIQQIMKTQVVYQNELSPNIRKWIVHSFWLSFFPFICILIYGISIENFYFKIAAAVFLILTLFYQWITFKNAKLYMYENVLLFKSGFWDVRYRVFESSKIQKIDVYQRIWHKKLNLGSIAIYTAAGVFYFTIADYSILKKNVNRWLYQLESKNDNWM